MRRFTSSLVVLFVAAFSAVGSPVLAIAQAGGCCTPGAACCYPGSPCCAGHAH